MNTDKRRSGKQKSRQLPVLYLCLSAFICGSFLLPAQAQTKRPMTPADVLALKQVSDPQISPDGSAVVYVVSVADFEHARSDSDLWLVRPGEAPRQITSNVGRDSSPRWSPDGKTIAFLRTRPEAGETSAQIWLLPADGGEARPLTSEPRGVSSFQWAPDSQSIFYLASDAPRPPRGRPEPQVEDEGAGIARLWQIWPATGRKSRFDAIEQHIREFAVAPDASGIALALAPTGYFNDVLKSELYLLDLRAAGAKPHRLTENIFPENGIQWRPDSAGFAFLAGADAAFKNQAFENNFFYFHNGAVRHVALPNVTGDKSESPGTPEQIEWLDARNLLVVAASNVFQRVYQWNLDTDRIVPATPGNSVSAGASAAPKAARFACVSQSWDSPNQVWLANIQQGANTPPPQRLTNHNPQVREFLLPKFELVRWKASDGVEVEGILLTPETGPSDKKAPWPLVTRIHGGPASAEMAGFQASAYVLTGMGIAVFLPNYRGSTNYGEAFAARSIGDRNGRDARDIEEGIDALIARGIADKDRLGVMGWSAGGVLTNWLIANNPRYRAASSGAGVADWTMQYFLSDYTWGSDLYFGGTPWQKHDLYWERSPLRLAAQVKTPTLIHSGANDERVPTPHCRAWYRALRQHGVTARFIVYPGEPHSLQQPAHQLRRLEEDAAWFRRFLLAP